MLGALCGETVALMHRLSGKGPTKCRAFWAGPDMLLVVLADGLTTVEQTVAAAGHERGAAAFRGLFQEVAEKELTEVVERLTERDVEAVMSTSHAGPDLTAFVFVLSRPAAQGETRSA
jgi:uncharacterized protein YbcI